ncbi:MAG: hypothetical protein CVT67_10320 [Actinobacteria bacterium HGW-Actinobacteria-7]|jgi:hypothetical protein|nr:MAG: hypothetical protein CVT67_10320 [Actinobacteria bacterium HGW-Actinobacteria-7]
MGRRSPSNERYQKFTSPAGKTRRSAAAAKPKRAIAAPSKPSKTVKSAKEKAKDKRAAALNIHPTTPEYKRLRLIWWLFLGGAIVLSTASWFLWKSPELRGWGNYILVAGYAFIIGAIYLDWSKLRPLRQAWIDSGAAEAATAEKEAAKLAKSAKSADTDTVEGSSADKKS